MRAETRGGSSSVRDISRFFCMSLFQYFDNIIITYNLQSFNLETLELRMI